MKKYLVFFLFSLITAVVSAQSIDESMQRAMERLSALEKDGTDEEIADALCKIAMINVYASLDVEGEKYACRAEEIARKNSLYWSLSSALLIRANICSYAETDSTFNRNDEGISYASEALAVARKYRYDSLVMESCFCLSQLYVNKNRWNHIIDRQLYDSAGMYLDFATSLSDTLQMANQSKVLAYKVRYYRQGNQIDEAISYCEHSFDKCKEDDYLLKSQLCDQLTQLYIASNELGSASDAHSAYSHFYSLYARQVQSDKLQELQVRYETEILQSNLEKRRYQIMFMVSLVILISALATVFAYRMVQEKRFRRIAEHESKTKQELIEFISKDLRNPMNCNLNNLETFVRSAGSMTEDQIISESQKLINEERHLSSDIAEYVSDLIIDRRNAVKKFGLSPRELDIIHLSLEGLSAAQIAERLFISPRTVSNHRANIYLKMGVKTNAEMCKKARESGLV